MRFIEDKYLETLALSSPVYFKEQDLVLTLRHLLFQVKDSQPLDQKELAYVKNKIGKVFCFSERYGNILDYLSDYDQRHPLH